MVVVTYTILGVARIILALQVLDHLLLFFLIELLPILVRVFRIAKCLS